ncbi:MAG: hypothetical protein HC915_19480 [Anaerolineae bacterium]|nr:hypothetical protein [Anaerolineae bacterium]
MNVQRAWDSPGGLRGQDYVRLITPVAQAVRAPGPQHHPDQRCAGADGRQRRRERAGRF